MVVSISELYGKRIITSDGRQLGEVKTVIVDVQEGTVSHLLLMDFENLQKEDDMREVLKKSSVLYKRVKSVGETIIVSRE